MAPDIPKKIDIVELEEPVSVVHRETGAAAGLLVSGLAQFQKAGELVTDSEQILIDAVLAEHLPHLGLTAWIADPTGPSAHQRDGTMPGTLQVYERHDGNKAPDMQTAR